MLSALELTCEYLHAPLGVDTPEPRFSWHLHDAARRRGCVQQAYQLRVERVTPEGLDLLWDSGRVESAQSVNVPYGGRALASFWDCRWSLRVWDGDGVASPWSDEQRFVMGVLDTADWNGEWIRSDQVEEHQHVWFRKRLTLDAVPQQFLAYVCSIGYHELYVNGERVGDAVLTPGVTNLQKRALYMTYDLAGMLNNGENVIALWTGPGWARADGSFGKGVWDQQAMFRCQIVGDTTPLLCTDTTWRCRLSSSENRGPWNGGGKGDYGGEVIDARRHQRDWNALDCDDSNWSLAVAGSQDLELSAACFEPDRKVECLSPVSITHVDGATRVDMGRNFAGWFELELRGGTEGQCVRILTANRAEETLEYNQESHYFFDASGVGTFSHRFNWMAGRWFTIEGLSYIPEATDIRGYVVTNDRARHGHFDCSNATYNWIYETDLDTYIANTVNAAVMDCPHRERYGYGEVSLACAWGCAIPNFASGAFYVKATRDWLDVQNDDGSVNTIAPQPYFGAGGALWSSALLTLAWEFYRAYGDQRVLERSYPGMKRWLDYLDAAVTEDGVLMPYAQASRFLGDWATPHGSEYGDTPEAQLFNNCVYAYDLMAFVQAAEILGHAEDVSCYSKRLNALRAKVHAHYYNEATGLYLDGLQQSLIFPLYTRVTPDHLRAQVLERLEQAFAEKGYLDTGSSGLPIMLKCITEDLHRPDLLAPALARMEHPGYGYFRARGATSWPEYWEVDGITSHIHTCYTGIAGYFMKGVAGIQADPDALGMQELLLRPGLVGDLSFANASTVTAYGSVHCNWSRENGVGRFHVELPPNTRARLYIPARALDDVTESGVSIDAAEGVDVDCVEAEHVVVRLGSGVYDFESLSVPHADLA